MPSLIGYNKFYDLNKSYFNINNIKKSNKLIGRSLLAISNVGRRLLVAVFGLILNFILINYHSIDVLNTYVYFVSIFALFFVFTNWGGRFFNTKQISKSPKGVKPLISSLISSKIILIFFSIIIIVFLPLEKEIKLLLILFLFLKSLTPIFDSLILYQKKSQPVFIVEIILNSGFLIFTLFYSSALNSVKFLLYFVLLELVKFMYYTYAFRGELSFKFSIDKGFSVLKKSIYFFGVTTAGFLASKADFYIVGILIDKQTMSYYFIISSLSGISMVIYASLINTFETSIYRFSKSVFKKLENALKGFGVIFSIAATVGFYIGLNYFYNIPVDIKFTLLFLVNIYLFTLLNFEMYRFTKLEKQKIILLILICAGVINLGFSFILIKKYILFGAFLANTISLLFNYLLLRLYLKKYIHHEV